MNDRIANSQADAVDERTDGWMEGQQALPCYNYQVHGVLWLVHKIWDIAKIERPRERLSVGYPSLYAQSFALITTLRFIRLRGHPFELRFASAGPNGTNCHIVSMSNYGIKLIKQNCPCLIIGTANLDGYGNCKIKSNIMDRLINFQYMFIILW